MGNYDVKHIDYLSDKQDKNLKSSGFRFLYLPFFLGFFISLVVALSVVFLIAESKRSETLKEFNQQTIDLTSKLSNKFYDINSLLLKTVRVLKISEYEMGIDWQNNLIKYIEKIDILIVNELGILHLPEEESGYQCQLKSIYGSFGKKFNFCKDNNFIDSLKQLDNDRRDIRIFSGSDLEDLYMSVPMYRTPLEPTNVKDKLYNLIGWVVVGINMKSLFDVSQMPSQLHDIAIYKNGSPIYKAKFNSSEESDPAFENSHHISTHGNILFDGMSISVQYDWHYSLNIIEILEYIMASIVMSFLVGSLIGVIYQKRDESQAMLTSTNETLRHVLSSTPGVMYVRDNASDWKFSFLSERFNEITGYKQISIKGAKDFFELVHEEDRETIKAAVKDGLENYGQYEIEYRIINCKRHPVWILDKGFLDEDKKSVRGVIIDINRTKKIEETTKQLNDALIHMADGIALLDKNETIVGVNKTLENIFGFSKTKLLELKLEDLVHEDDRALVRDAFKQISEKSKIELDVRGIVTDEKDSELFLNLTIVPVRDAKLKIKGAYTFIKDVSVRKIYENQLKEAKNQIADAYKIKSEFFAIMSHRMRSPMNVIMGYCDMLIEELSKEGSDQLAMDVRQIEASAKSLLLLVDDIIDISKLESGHIIVNNNVFAVSDIIENAMSRIENKLHEKKNNIKTVIGNEIDFMNSDFGKVEQNLVNLLSNAVKFTENGEISLTIQEQEPGKIYFIVEDSGVGIDKDKIQRLFKPFAMFNESQLDNALDHTGLGLAITHRFCQLLGGDLLVESESGKGSTFIMVIPKGEIGDIADRKRITMQT